MMKIAAGGWNLRTRERDVSRCRAQTACMSGGVWPLWVGAILVVAALSAGVAAAETPWSGTITILAAGREVAVLEASPSLLQDLQIGMPPRPDSLPIFLPMDASAVEETLALGDPILRASLPGAAAGILPPEPGRSEAFVVTQGGLARIDLASPKTPPEVFLPGWNLSSATRLSDGSFLLLERTYDDHLLAALPAHLFSYQLGATLPDTVAVCPAGAMHLHRTAADSVVWITRMHTRAANRLVRRGDRWELTEHEIVRRARVREERWNLRIGMAPPTGGVLLVEQGRGARPRLLEVDDSGRARELYVWPRGIGVFSADYAPEARLVLLNGVTNFSLCDLNQKTELSRSVAHLATAVALSSDGEWMVTCQVLRGEERTMVELRRRGCARSASVILEDPVSAVALLAKREP